jgi:soluble lytic murein transglycosylase
LTQLKVSTAGDVARWRRERPPDERALFDPALNLRYGADYLEHQIDRFASIEVALAAYNAGAGRIPERWRDWMEQGGPALFAELIVYPETRDYVRKILGVRQAYRELRPYGSAAR